MKNKIELIDKAKVIEEIEGYKNSFCDRNGYLEDRETNGLAYDTLCELEDSINTLEVKEVDLEVREVDLENEIENLIEKEKAFVTDNREVKYYNGDSFNHIYELEFIAKHFYELGLKTKKVK